MAARPRLLAHIPWLLLAFLAPAAAAAPSPRLVASLDDDAHDATGPGDYQPPGDTDFVDGDFDLRRLAVYSDGEDVLFQVTLGAPIREPPTMQRTNRIPLQLLNGIYLQNIDIYVDTDPASAEGFDVCIPGRRVAFEEGRTWKAAVVITPQPEPAHSITLAALGPGLARHVFFPEVLDVRGRVITVRVPEYVFGGPPRKSWGYSVHVSGATWERSFSALDLLRSGKEANAFTMPVVGMRQAFAFGGAPSGEAHPRVVDVLLPPGTDQKVVLGSFNASAGTFARVPFVYGEGSPPPLQRPATAEVVAPAAPPVAEAPPATKVGAPPAVKGATPRVSAPPAPTAGLRVVDVSGDTISVSGPVAGLKEFQLGQVIGASGAPVARVVILRVFEGGLVATVVDGRDRIERGSAVRFDGPTP